jgi:hypothetical protein
MTWQPIETAPKDGTRIILFLPSRYSFPAMVTIGLWFEDFLPGRNGWSYCEVDEIGQFIEEPITHWMPLPPPPEVET